ncbi:hypothetical protein JYU34_002240 [Plutella xylostella]|uniref:Peroxisomal ATPase PEX1 n=1 Tax=Plutella xylostella TaxID=51655 RepID=A0ABQ7R1M5_PLUXY|nr:hypothetical protein JYU34_002240 [Plutella xylostella]
MLGGVKLKVNFTHEKTCFGYISPKYSTNNEQSQCVQVLCKDKHILLWVMFSSNVPEGQIACNPIFARLVGLSEGVEVFVSPYSDTKVLEELYIDADSPDDQEILEHNAELLQLRILDQLRFVAANQKAVVWISVSLPIVFTAKQTGLLVNHSRVVIKVDAFNTLHKPPQLTNKTTNKSEDSSFNNIGKINEGMLRPYLHPPKRLVLRAVPIDSDGKKDLIHPFTVFVHEDLIEEKDKGSTILATIQNCPSVINDFKDDGETKNELIDDMCVEIVPIDKVIFRSLSREVYNKNIPTVLIPKSLNTIVNIENGMKIIMTLINNTIEQPEHIDIVTDGSQSETDVVEKFKTCVIDNTHSGRKFLINNNIVKQNLQIADGFIQFKLQPERLKYTVVNSESLRHCTISAKNNPDLVPPKIMNSSLDYDCKNLCRSMKSVENLVTKVVSHLYFEIHREATFKGASEIKSNVLVTGASGTGKSSLCRIVQKELTVWSHILHCRSLKGRKDIPDVLGKAILMCQEHNPSVLICDDVDSLVHPDMEGAASPTDIAYYQRLAVLIKSSLQSCSGVAVLMTATGVNDLHPTLAQFSGKPLFTAQFEIGELDQEERTELFKHLVNNNIRSQFLVEDDDVIRLAMDTAGQNVRDISDYLNKRIFKAVKRKSGNPTDKPRLLDSSELEKKQSEVSDVWATVGGMEEVTQQLTEAIFWPLMYPALFPDQSCGVLLYGPPGTGKSLIGSCLSAAPQVNFIAVKGPELLSKYIGQSEKHVRDIFDKADMQRPYVLFFDEFDSLAPKRGHDSTGVTDRVVNQLLARLDGAEGGAGGAVLAASSRPDLLDPALLRAGRLQTHVMTSMPPEAARLSILKTLAKDVTISPEVDLASVAARTEGFSPADLKSLLVTAQLTSLEDQLDNPEESAMKAIVVSKEDIERALEETQPSLSKEQLKFYDTVYKRFRGESLTKEEATISSELNRQRVTLA